MKRSRYIFALTLVVLTAVIGATGYIFVHRKPERKDTNTPATLAVSSKRYNSITMSQDVPSEFKQLELSKEDIADNFLDRMTKFNNDGLQEMLITVRNEKRFNLVSGLTKKEPVDVILDNIAKNYPQRFPGYKKLRQQKFTTAGVEAAEVVFVYDSPSGQKAKQHILVLMRTKDEAVYVAYQALEKDFDRLDTTYFSLMRKSIKFD